MFGTVTKYFNDKGYGFIRGEDGKSYFVHKSKLKVNTSREDIMYSSDHL